MSRLATRRLIDAAGSLDPTERALLNLWVNRGLDDPALARMTGLEPATIAARRARIVTNLSDELGLPPDQIRGALAEMASSSADRTDSRPNGQFDPNLARPEEPVTVTETETGPETGPETEIGPETAPELEGGSGAPAQAGSPARNGHAPGATTDVESALSAGLIGPAAPTTEPRAPSPAAPAPLVAPERGRRRGLWALIGVLGLIVVVFVTFLTSGSSPPSRPAGHRVRARTTPSVPNPPSSPSPSPTVSQAPSQPLGVLPGGVDRATGSVLITGRPRHLKLKLSVSHLPAAHDGHYEVWLYNSIIDSNPLGRLRTGRTTVSLRLPGNAHHYQWIDVSFQPVGTVFHSGESILRAANPAAASPARLQKRSVRHRTLRPASSGSSRASTS